MLFLNACIQQWQIIGVSNPFWWRTKQIISAFRGAIYWLYYELNITTIKQWRHLIVVAVPSLFNHHCPILATPIFDQGFSFFIYILLMFYGLVSRNFLTVTFSINFEIICRFQNNKKIFYAWEHCHIKHKKVNKRCLSLFIA